MKVIYDLGRFYNIYSYCDISLSIYENVKGNNRTEIKSRIFIVIGNNDAQGRRIREDSINIALNMIETALLSDVIKALFNYGIEYASQIIERIKNSRKDIVVKRNNNNEISMVIVHERSVITITITKDNGLRITGKERTQDKNVEGNSYSFKFKYTDLPYLTRVLDKAVQLSIDYNYHDFNKRENS